MISYSFIFQRRCWTCMFVCAALRLMRENTTTFAYKSDEPYHNKSGSKSMVQILYLAISFNRSQVYRQSASLDLTNILSSAGFPCFEYQPIRIRSTYAADLKFDWTTITKAFRGVQGFLLPSSSLFIFFCCSFFNWKPSQGSTTAKRENKKQS